MVKIINSKTSSGANGNVHVHSREQEICYFVDHIVDHNNSGIISLPMTNVEQKFDTSLVSHHHFSSQPMKNPAGTFEIRLKTYKMLLCSTSH